MAKSTLKVEFCVSEFGMLDSPKHSLMIIYSVTVQLTKPADQIKVIPELSWSSWNSQSVIFKVNNMASFPAVLEKEKNINVEKQMKTCCNGYALCC